MKLRIYSMIFSACALLSGNVTAASEGRPAKPNVLLVLTVSMGWHGMKDVNWYSDAQKWLEETGINMNEEK